MCIDNRDLYSACGHCTPSKCCSEPCTEYVARRAGGNGPGSSQPICRHHRCYITVHPDWCEKCIMQISNIVSNDAHAAARNPSQIGRYWQERTRLEAPDLHPREPRLFMAPTFLWEELAAAAAAPCYLPLDELTRGEMLRGRRSFAGARHWRSVLEREMARCVPEAVLIDGLLWPNKPWLADRHVGRRRDGDGDGDGDGNGDDVPAQATTRLAEIAGLAQALTMRWVVSENPDRYNPPASEGPNQLGIYGLL